MFGITNSCELKDGAWKFIRQFLVNKGSSPAQDDYSEGLSIRKDVNETRISEEAEFNAGDERFSSGKADEYREFLNRPVFSSLVYTGVKRIVTEETDAFFRSEDITAEETAKAVQNKVMLYLNEIS